MKIILTEDVKKLGKKGEIIDVSDGYARNFILPKKYGVEATAKNLNDMKLKQANDAKVAAEQLAEAKAFAEKLNGAEVTVSIKTGEGGKVFGSVSNREIAQEAKTQLGYELDHKKMQLKEPIKEIGVHTVTIRLHPQVTAEFRVNVTGKA